MPPTEHPLCVRDPSSLLPPRSPSTNPDKETAASLLALSALRSPGRGRGRQGDLQLEGRRRAPGQVGLALRVWSGSASGGTAWVYGTEWGGHLHRGNRPRPRSGFPGRAGPPPGPAALEAPLSPRLQPLLTSPSLHPSPLGRSRTRQVRRCGRLADAASKPRPVSGLSLVSPGWGGASAQNKCVFHALGLFRHICGGWMKPPSQVGIPSGLPRPRGPDVLPALGGAGAEAPDRSPPRAPRGSAGIPGASGGTCLLLPFPRPSPEPSPGERARGESKGPPAGFVRLSAKWNCGPRFQKYAQFRDGNTERSLGGRAPLSQDPR